MPAQPAVPAVPVVPGYVLEELLGSGGSGQVWRARPRAGGPPVAVKVLVRGDPARQEREAALLGELDHPHLVRLHGVVRHEVRSGAAEVALVLDLLPGGSLGALLARRGRLRPGEVVTTVAPIAAALAHAHDRGIVHGDLSPGNVVFTAEGRPVLTDLGTARLVGDTARAEVTPAYVDPVVARGGAPGPASDVFGLAAAAFHALTGISPWNAADPGNTLAVASSGELPDLALLAPEAPDELVRVVRRGLSAEPHERGTAAEFALDLRHACRPEPVRLPVPGVPDAELGRTGAGPRTELTHQVPVARPRSAHAAPPAHGRLARLRARLRDRLPAGRVDGGELRLVTGAGETVRRVVQRVAVAGAVVLVVAAGLGGAAWAGAHWGSGPDVPRPAAETAPAPEATGPQGPAPAPAGPTPQDDGAPDGAGSVAGASGGGAEVGEVPVDGTPRAEAPAGEAPADWPGTPADEAGWVAVLTDLYARRATAFGHPDPAALTAVYVPGSGLLARDTALLQTLADAGQALEGFAPEVRRLESVSVDGEGRAVLRLVDALPGYRVVPTGGPAAAPGLQVGGRGEAAVRIVLQRTADGWRIEEAAVQS